MSALLDIRRLDVWIETPERGDLHIVRDMTLALERGDKLAIVGESGSGKTTAMLALLGLLPAAASVAGSIRFDGRELLAPGDPIASLRWNGIAVVLQGAMNAFSPVTRIGRQIVEPMVVREGLGRAAAVARARDLLGRVGLRREHFDCFPHELSGGMRQRAAMAMALACDPRLLIADEPTTALDLMVQAQILELLGELCEERELTLVMITHDLAAVGHVCERAAVMYAGELVEQGPVAELAGSPRHPYTRLLFDAMPSLDLGRELRSIPGAPPAPDHELPGCPFEPRCDRALPSCQTTRPQRRNVGPGRQAACHLNADSEAVAL